MTAGKRLSSKGWLIIPVEVQVRELLGRLLVAALAADRGYDVLIGHDRVVRRLARFLPRGILFDKSLGAAGDRKVRRYHRLGYSLTALDEESTGFYPNPELYLNTRLSEDTLERAARWFTISDRLADAARQRYPRLARNIVTTGLPRTDIWRPQFHGLYASQCEKIRHEHGDFLLFCSNFGSIIHARAGAFVQQQFDKQEKAYTSAAQYQANIMAQGQQNLEAFVAVLPKLAAAFPQMKIIIRPHPSEDRGFWHRVAADIPNTQVEDEGLATPWILASRCLFHHGCTTGIEAELLGQPHVMYAPFPDDHHDTQVMRAFAPIVNSQDELVALLGDIVSGATTHSKPREALEEFYASLVGKLASAKIVDEFDELAEPHGEKLPGWLSLLRFTPRHLVAQYWPESTQARAYSRQKWQGTSLAEIRNALTVIVNGAQVRNSLRATQVFPQLFRIRAERD